MKNMKRLSLALLLIFLACLPTCAQTELSGTVVDANGLSIIGANILEKGTTNGTITDLDGNFTIRVSKPNAVLVFTYIGYLTQELPAVNGMKVVLKEDSQSLDEVVVVGYGVQKKSNLTGSISSVKASDIENRTVSDVNQSLQGKTAGVQLLSTSSSPGAESSIRIRGFSSNSTSDPLYVVDGVRVNSITNIDPNDIESMEVLKDAASAAIYGAEAGNGVVLVTTKKGQKGEGKISYDFQYAIQSLNKKAEVMNAQQYLDYMVQSKAMDKAKAESWDGVESNWCDILFDSSPMQKHSLSFQNASDKSSIYASLNYLQNNGIVAGDKDQYKRITGNINVDYDLKPWLTFSTSNVITYMKRQSVAENDPFTSVLRSALSLDPCTPNIYSANNLAAWMQPLVDAGYKLVKDDNGDYYSISTYLNGADDINPNILIYSGHNKNWGTYIQGNTALNIKPLKGLTITTRLGYRFGSMNDNTYQAAYYATATKNQSDPIVSMTTRSSKYYQWENFANYLFNIGEHNFTVMAGTSYSADRISYSTSGGQRLQVDNENYAYPNFLASSAYNLVTDGDDVETRKLSYFGRLSYDYAARYLLQVTMRADAADLSILPNSNRWGYFPAVSLGWTVSNEKWFPQNTPVSLLKVRASWGQNGSIAGLTNFAYNNAIKSAGGYSFVAGKPEYTTSSIPSSTGNQNLKWETSEQSNVGIDARLFNSRLSFSVDYFIKKTKDLIVSGTNPTLTVGNTVSPVNAGNVENKGFEFDLSWKDKIGDFNYSISGNLATLSNEVTYLDPTIDRISGFNYNGNVVTAFEKGYPVWYYRGYVVDHIDSGTGNPVYRAHDGSLTEKPSAGDLTMIGSAIPDFTYGVTINLSYKNVDFVVFGQGSQGNEVFSALTKPDRPVTNRLACYYTDAWTSSHTDAKFARMDYQESYYWRSNAVVFDGSYFKIKQIQLGYNLPKVWMNKIGMSGLRVYASLDDFFLFTNYPGMDPESSSGSTTALGVDLGSYPNAKKVVFGFNLTF